MIHDYEVGYSDFKSPFKKMKELNVNIRRLFLAYSAFKKALVRPKNFVLAKYYYRYGTVLKTERRILCWLCKC